MSFELALGLVWDENENIYFVNESLHQKLIETAPEFTFRLGNNENSQPTVNITLPYSSFDLIMSPPILEEATPYFPLRRGNESQITLGRAFLQEA